MKFLTSLLFLTLLISCKGGSGGSSSDEGPAAPVKHVFLIVGQSNAVGIGSVGTCADMEATDARIEQMSRGINALGTCSYTASADGTWMVAQQPLQHGEVASAPDRIGFAMTFAKEYLATLPEQDSIRLVPAARSNTSFAAGNWVKGGADYNDAIARANAAIAEGGVLKGILWHQGESDALNSTHAANYRANLVQMITDMRADITGASDVPFLIGGMGPNFIASGAYPQQVDQTQQIIDQYHTNVAYVSSAGLTMLDAYHLDAVSQKTFGQRYFAALSNTNSYLATPPITGITSSSLNANAGQILKYVSTLSTSGGVAPYTYSIQTDASGQFSLSGADLSMGTLTPGSYPITVRSTDNNGTTYDETLTFTVANATISTKSYSFTGDHLRMDNTANAFFNFDQAFTAHFLVFPINGTGTLIDTTRQDATSRGVRLYMTNGQLAAMYINNWPANRILNVSFDAIPLNRWSHVTFTYDNSGNANGLRIYINGVQVSTNRQGSITGSVAHDADIFIGKQINTQYPLLGNLDEVSFWDVALTAGEINEYITSLNVATHSRVINLVRHYKLGENGGDDGTTFVDTNGSGNLTGVGTNVGNFMDNTIQN